MRAIRDLCLTLALAAAALPAAPAAAKPAGFGCLWPVQNLAINPQRSRFYTDQTEWVFDLPVSVNQPAPRGGIAVGVGSTGPHKVGVCKIVLPNLQQLRRAIDWREVGAGTGPGTAAYRNLDIREAGAGGSFTEWLVLRPKSRAVAGATVIEFHVYSGYSSDAD